MVDKDIRIGNLINTVGIIGILSGLVLLAFTIVMLVFRHGFGLDIPKSFHWFW